MEKLLIKAPTSTSFKYERNRPMLNEQKSELRAEIEDAFSKAGINDYIVVNATAIIKKIKKNYVSGNPRAWWLSLKNKIDILHYEDDSGYKYITEIVENKFSQAHNSYVFFLADEDNEQMYLYKAPLSALVFVIEQCRYFECYMVSEELSWLVCENDHGEIIVCSTSLLKRYFSRGPDVGCNKNLILGFWGKLAFMVNTVMIN